MTFLSSASLHSILSETGPITIAQERHILLDRTGENPRHSLTWNKPKFVRQSRGTVFRTSVRKRVYCEPSQLCAATQRAVTNRRTVIETQTTQRDTSRTSIRNGVGRRCRTAGGPMARYSTEQATGVASGRKRAPASGGGGAHARRRQKATAGTRAQPQLASARTASAPTVALKTRRKRVPIAFAPQTDGVNRIHLLFFFNADIAHRSSPDDASLRADGHRLDWL